MLPAYIAGLVMPIPFMQKNMRAFVHAYPLTSRRLDPTTDRPPADHNFPISHIDTSPISNHNNSINSAAITTKFVMTLVHEDNIQSAVDTV